MVCAISDVPENTIERDDEESLVDLDEDDNSESNITETHNVNVAYGFTYVYVISEDDGINISCYTNICYYYDGLDSYEFPTKQEAIDAYLAPVFE